MNSKEIMLKSINQHRVRVEYFNRLKSLMRSTPGSEIVMSKGEYHITWPIYELKRGEEVLATVLTSGKFLNHWFKG